MSSLPYLVFLLITPSVVFGRLGDNQRQAAERYGQPLIYQSMGSVPFTPAEDSNDWNLERWYNKNNLIFHLKFLDGICWQIEIKSADNIMLGGSAMDMTEPEAMFFTEKSMGSSISFSHEVPYQYSSDITYQDRIYTAPGELEAKFCKARLQITNTQLQKKLQERLNNSSKQQAEGRYKGF